MTRRVVRLPSEDDVAEVVAGRLLDRLLVLQAERDLVHVCLTGGETADRMYERFAELADGSALDASKLQLWWGDDRFLPATDPDRNSLQAITRLARTVAIKSADIHMMPVADGRADPFEAAADYATELGATSFDITLMGMGTDGHIGSIFPGHPSFEPTNRSVIGVTDAPKPPEQRITLTIPTFNRSDELWFIVSGSAKADAVVRALADDESLPATHVRGKSSTLWFIDEAAAAGLDEPYRCLF